MVRALGTSLEAFDPRRPGRLCRGREAWVRAAPLPEDAPALPIARRWVTGATFSDEVARDARRGLPHAGIGAGAVLEALFPGRRLVAFCEAAELVHVPAWADEPEEEDLYWSWRAGGRVRLASRRWVGEPPEPALLSPLVAEERVDGVVVLPPGGETVDAALRDALYLLAGQGDTTRRPVHRASPAAIPDVLEHAEALALVHLDKNGPALGIYRKGTPESFEEELAALEALARREGALCIPFAIPPILARWDRAIRDHRQRWDREALGPYPVPRRATREGTGRDRLGDGGQAGRGEGPARPEPAVLDEQPVRPEEDVPPQASAAVASEEE